MSKLGSIHASLTADYSQFTRGFQGAEREASKSIKSISSLAGGIGGVLTGIGTGIAAAFSVGEIIAMTREVANASDVFADAAAISDLSTDSLQRYSYAANLTGTSLETLTTSYSKLQSALVQARDGSEEFTANLTNLGVTQEQIASLDTEGALMAIADAFAASEHGALKDEYAKRLLGKTSRELNDFLSLGSKRINELGDEMESLGGLMSADMIDASSRFNDELYRLGVQADAAKRDIVGGLIPALADLFEKFNAARAAGLGFWKSLMSIELSGDSVLAGTKTVGQNRASEIESLEKDLFRLQELQVEYENAQFNEQDKRGGLFGANRKGLFSTHSDKSDEIEKTQKQLAELKRLNEALTSTSQTKLLAEQDADFSRIEKKTLNDIVITAEKPDRPKRAGGRSQSDDLAREAERAAEEARRLGDSIRRDIITPYEQYEQAIGRLIDAQKKGVINDDEVARAAAKYAENFDAAIKGTDEYRAALAATEERQRIAAQLFDETRTPIERLNIEMAKLDAQFADGAIGLDVYARKMFNLTDAVDEMPSVVNEVKTVFDEFGDAASRWGDQFADVLLDASASFEDFATGILKQLAKIAISAALTPWLEKFGGFIGGIGGAAPAGSAASSVPVGAGGKSSIGALQAQAPVINQTINISGSPTPAQLRAWGESIKAETINTIARDSRRRG